MYVVQMCLKVYFKFLLLYLDFVNLLSISKTKVSIALPEVRSFLGLVQLLISFSSKLSDKYLVIQIVTRYLIECRKIYLE